MTQSFEMASLAVNQRWPVLLCGPAGCGKTALTKKLANDYGGRGISFSDGINTYSGSESLFYGFASLSS